MKKPVTYSRELREIANQQRKHLITIDVPGMCYQGPVSGERRTELIELVTRWFKENESIRKAEMASAETET